MSNIANFGHIPEVDDEGIRLPPPEAKELGQLFWDGFDDPFELFEHRFLGVGGGLLLVGPTGIGKSAFVLQCAIQWAIGEPAFGIRPSRPLRILIVQAENDEGDLVEMRSGVLAALKLSKVDSKYACENVLIATENARTGFEFFRHTVEPLLKQHNPDLLIIDPALAYLGGDTNSQKDVGNFLRNQLNPLLTEYRCGCIVVHHTNKPPQGKEKSTWQAGDFAYLGSGSAEWSNWARAVMAIRSVGSHDVFELRAGKRGGRLGWTDEAGDKSYHKYIAHAKEPGMIYWREADASEIPSDEEGGAPPESIVLSLVPETGTVPKQYLLDAAGENRVGQHKARKILNGLVEAGVLFEHPEPRKGNKPIIHLSREPRKTEDALNIEVVTAGNINPVITVKTSDR
jgi:hypothetical protein